MNNNPTRILFVIAGVAILLLFGLFTYNENASSEKREKIIKEKTEAVDTTNEPSEVNIYSVKSVNQEEMAKLYYYDYKNLIVNFEDEAYAMIENSDVITKASFMDYRNQLMSDYYNYNFESFSYYKETTTNSYVYRVTTTQGEIFSFKTTAVMQYKVNIEL
ncbi:MAG: hypothetical protein IJN90_03090 [Bacilli bacterium]|nr:hypothetical protein [Bacilli bacterium]